MRELPPLPAPPPYGDATLGEVLPSVASALGVPGFDNALGVEPLRRACVLLVDGLGWFGLQQARDAAPFLTGHSVGRKPLSAGVPSTTATSLTSLGTGAPPGSHGVTGMQVAVPGSDRVLNCLAWDPSVDPQAWQPLPTVFERAAADGVAVTRVAPARFDGWGLTAAGLRGGAYAGADAPGEIVAGVEAALRAGERALVYAYTPELDATGHRKGCGSAAWRYQLAHVDRLVAQLAEALPPGATLFVTADHGMVDVPHETRVDLAAEPELLDGVRVLAGEPRARHVHAVHGAAPDVLAAWRERLGATVWVLSGDEAVDMGLFGPVVPARVRPRIGDVVALAAGTVAVVHSGIESAGSLALRGLHGSVTPEEMLVPFLEVRG